MLLQLGFILSRYLARFEGEEGQGIVEYMLIFSLCVGLLTTALSYLLRHLDDVYTIITATLRASTGS